MKSQAFKKFSPLLIVAFAMALAAVMYWLRPEPKVVDKVSEPLLVNVIEAVKQDIEISVRTQGTVQPRTETTLIAEVAGKVVEVSDNFKVGGFFRQGDELLRIDQRDYLASVKRAEAAVASAHSNLASEKGRAEVAYQDWVKYKGSVNRTEAATALALRKPQLEDAQASLDSALAELEQAKIELDRTIIRAPYDGVFKTHEVDIGQYVNVGTVLADIFAIDKAEVRLALPPHKLDYLDLPGLGGSSTRPGANVRLEAEIGDRQLHWEAQLVRTEGVFDERSRVLFAVAEIADPYGIYQPRDNELRIGTFVDAHVQGRRMQDIIALPRTLLRTGNRLWVLDGNAQVYNRQVRTLRTDGPQVYITAGLEEGELVCASNFSGAIPGTKVRVAEKTLSSVYAPGYDTQAAQGAHPGLGDNANDENALATLEATE